MKFIFNRSQSAYTNIDNCKQVFVGEGKKGLQSAFAVVVCLGDNAKAPLAFFSDKGEAEEFLESVIDFCLKGDADVLEVEDKVNDSILVTPDVMKSKGE